MARIDSLKARQRNLLQQHKDAQAAYDAATDPEERKKIRAKAKDIKAEFDIATEDVAAEAATLEAEAAMGGAAPEHPSTTAANRTRDSAIQLGENRQLADPKKGFASPRDFMMTVMRAGQKRASAADLERLSPLYQQAVQGSDEASGTSNPFGGYLVPEAFSPNLLQVTPEGDFTAGRTRVIPMASKVVTFPARVDKNHSSSVSGGLTVTRKPETVDGTASRTEFEKVTMVANSLYGFAFATEEILIDSAISFSAMIASGFSQEFVNRRLSEILTGTGVGEFEGILNSPALVTITKEGSQPNDTIKTQNVIKMRARCYGYQTAIWIANHDTMPQLMTMELAVGSGGAPVYVSSIREDRPDLLLGRPIFYSEYPKTLGDKGDIVLANFAEYLDGAYMPLQSAESIHVRFMANERTFRFWKRDDGRCWWRSALTPKNSAATMSPFVVIEAR